MRVGGGRSGLGLLGRGLSALAVVVVLTGAASSPPTVSAPPRRRRHPMCPPPTPASRLARAAADAPRFVSLKAGRVNVRVGPGEDYKVAWVFTKPALPVEVIQEFDTWRRIRDSDGSVGWVFHSLLSGKRTAVVTPWASGDPLPIRARRRRMRRSPPISSRASRPRSTAAPPAGAISRATGFSGWIEQSQLWGVYPDEAVD